MKILFVTQYGPLAASSRTRVFNYLPFLRARGVDCDVLTVLPDARLAAAHLVVTRNPARKVLYYLWAAWRTLACGLTAAVRGRAADVVFVQKVIFPAPVRWLLRRLGRPLVYDFDDAIFTTEVRSGHWLVRWKARRNGRGLPAMLALTRLAVVENDYTGGFARRYCPTLTITGPIDTEPFRRCAGPPQHPAGTVTLGWIGSGSTVAYLDLARAPLQALARRHPGLRLLVVGARWEAAGVTVECRPWSLAREADDLAGCDIGIMPVPDDPWTRGKGGYKLLQYMAAGLPVVAHPVGINADIVLAGQTGLLAVDGPAWEAALERLLADPELRRRMGQAGRARAEATYSLAAQQERLLAALSALPGAAA